MMRIILVLVLCLLALPVRATPPDPLFYNDPGYSSFWYGREFDVPPGIPAGQLAPAYGSDTHDIPAGYLRQITVTSTVKSDGVQVLAALVCSGKALWVGNHYKGTVPAVVTFDPPMPITTANCHIWVHTTSTNATVQIRAYEMQVTGIVTPTP